MYILNNKARFENILMAGVIFSVLTILLATNSPVITIFDSLIQDFIKNLTFNIGWLNTLVLFLSSKVLTGLYVFILWFLLWGNKHKLIATWCASTYIAGNILFSITTHAVNRALPLNHPASVSGLSYPTQQVFSMFLICYFIFVAVLPFIQKALTSFAIILVMWIFILFLIFAAIKTFTGFPFDCLGAILLGYLVIQCFELVYLHFFVKLQNLSIFINSDFN